MAVVVLFGAAGSTQSLATKSYEFLVAAIDFWCEIGSGRGGPPRDSTVSMPWKCVIFREYALEMRECTFSIFGVGLRFDGCGAFWCRRLHKESRDHTIEPILFQKSFHVRSSMLTFDATYATFGTRSFYLALRVTLPLCNGCVGPVASTEIHLYVLRSRCAIVGFRQCRG